MKLKLCSNSQKWCGWIFYHLWLWLNMLICCCWTRMSTQPSEPHFQHKSLARIQLLNVFQQHKLQSQQMISLEGWFSDFFGSPCLISINLPPSYQIEFEFDFFTISVSQGYHRRSSNTFLALCDFSKCLQTLNNYRRSQYLSTSWRAVAGNNSKRVLVWWHQHAHQSLERNFSDFSFSESIIHYFSVFSYFNK